MSLDWKVYKGNEYVASCRYAEDAAALVAAIGNTARIKDGHRKVVWSEGAEGFSAGESYGRVAEVVHQRKAERRNK